MEKQLFKKVKKVPLNEILPGFTYPPGFDHAVVDENKNILNFCTKKYNLIPNEAIFSPVEFELEKAGFNYKRNIQIINNSKFYVDYILHENKCKSPTINDVFPKISVWNSYDGKIKFRKEYGYYKLLCLNGLTTSLVQFSGKSAKHYVDSKTGTTNFNDINKSIKSFAASVKTFINQSKSDMELFELMNHYNITKKDIKRILKNIKLSKKVSQIAIDRYNTEVNGGFIFLNETNEEVEHEGSPETLFTLYNALNYAMYNTNVKELPEKKLEKDIVLLRTVEAEVLS